MPHFIVHAIAGSPYTRSVLATLVEKNAGFSVTALPPGGSKREPHLSRHPFGRVPVLEHDGFLLYETQAILRYLDRVVPAPALTPEDAMVAARMDQIIGICDWYLFHGVNNVIGFQRLVAPRLMGLAPDEAAVAAAMPKAHTVFAELSRLLGEKAFLADDALTLADMMVGPQLDFLSATPEWEPLTAQRPNLVRWLDRMRARPSFEATTWERVAALMKAA